MSEIALIIVMSIAGLLALLAVYELGYVRGQEDAKPEACPAPPTVTRESIERAYDFHHGVDELPARTRDGARAYDMERTPAQREAFDAIRESFNPELRK